jgi:hypothetical protein
VLLLAGCAQELAVPHRPHRLARDLAALDMTNGRYPLRQQARIDENVPHGRRVSACDRLPNELPLTFHFHAHVAPPEEEATGERCQILSPIQLLY